MTKSPTEHQRKYYQKNKDDPTFLAKRRAIVKKSQAKAKAKRDAEMQEAREVVEDAHGEDVAGMLSKRLTKQIAKFTADVRATAKERINMTAGERHTAVNQKLEENADLMHTIEAKGTCAQMIQQIHEAVEAHRADMSNGLSESARNKLPTKASIQTTHDYLDRAYRKLRATYTDANRPEVFASAHWKCDNLDWMEDVDGVAAKLGEIYPNQNSLFSMLMKFGAWLRYFAGKKRLWDRWQVLTRPIGAAIAAARTENKMSSREKSNLVPYSQVLDALEEHEDQVGSREYTLVAIYTLFPSRRTLDYARMHLHTVSTDKQVVDMDPTTLADDETNYLVMGKKKAKFIFNRFKTDKHYKQQVFSLDDATIQQLRIPPLIPVLQKYIKQNKVKGGDPLFGITDDKKFGKAVFTSYERLVGKHIGSTGARVIFASRLHSIGNLSEAFKLQIADRFAHSVQQSELYKRVDLEIPPEVAASESGRQEGHGAQHIGGIQPAKKKRGRPAKSTSAAVKKVVTKAKKNAKKSKK